MSDVIDWLLDGAPGAQRPPDVLDQLCRRLIASGFPLDRAAVFVLVLHPQYVAYSTHWLPDRPIEVRPAPYELATEDGFLRSPATLVMSRGFPLAQREPGAVCAAALRAAGTATRAVAALDLEPPARCGMALHLGEVSYGNIGAGNRLDFTAIGPAVNLAARIEPLNAQRGRDLLVSGTFAGLVDAALEPLGTFSLRGFPEPMAVYGLAA